MCDTLEFRLQPVPGGNLQLGLQVHPLSIFLRRLKARIHHLLRFQRPHRPVVVELAGENLVGEIVEHQGVLRRRMAARRPIRARRNLSAAGFGDPHFRLVEFKRGFVTVERMDKIGQSQPAFLAADGRPLLEFRQKRTVKTRGNTTIKKQFAGQIRWCRHVAGNGGGLREDATGDRARQLPVHRPQRESDAIPAEVAQAAGGFEPAIHANVVAEKIFAGIKTKDRGNAPELANAPAIVEHFADACQARAVHEHHAVHELHAVFPAGVNHLLKVGRAQGAGFFANDVFARRCRAQDPFLAQAGRQRKINRVHVFGGDQFLVTAQRRRRIFKRGFPLAFHNELAAAFEIAAGHGGYDRIAAVKNAVQFFRAMFAAPNIPNRSLFINTLQRRSMSVAKICGGHRPRRYRLHRQSGVGETVTVHAKWLAQPKPEVEGDTCQWINPNYEM